MLAWILILGSWIALVSLILHDVTQEDANGGAIRLAAGHVGAAMSWAVSAVSWAMLKARTFRETRRQATSQQATSQQAASQEGASRPPLKRLLTLRKPNWWHTDQRISMTATELEGAIAEAVRKASPACEGFLSVIVEPKPPKSRLDPDWDLRGVRFGKADRKMADEALSTVVKRMQQEVRLKPD
jgi:transposase InsO family protein